MSGKAEHRADGIEGGSFKVRGRSQTQLFILATGKGLSRICFGWVLLQPGNAAVRHLTAVGLPTHPANRTSLGFTGLR
jgi:hypothetical protein